MTTRLARLATSAAEALRLERAARAWGATEVRFTTTGLWGEGFGDERELVRAGARLRIVVRGGRAFARRLDSGAGAPEVTPWSKGGGDGLLVAAWFNTGY